MSRTFVLSPGRSGSHSFAKAWEEWTGVHCDIPGHNEPFPPANCPLEVSPDDFVTELFGRLPKDYAHASIQGPFGHGLAPYLCKHGAKVVYLYRDPIATARSLKAMDMIPGRSERGRSYHPSPPLNAPDATLWAAIACWKLAVQCKRDYPDRLWWMPTEHLPYHLNTLEDRMASPHENDRFPSKP